MSRRTRVPKKSPPATPAHRARVFLTIGLFVAPVAVLVGSAAGTAPTGAGHPPE